LFHNSNLFGSCIIRILYTECANIKKNSSGAKRLRWLSVVLARLGFQPSLNNRQWWWAIDTPETCRDVWRNILKMNCASRWYIFKWIYRDARSTKHKVPL